MTALVQTSAHISGRRVTRLEMVVGRVVTVLAVVVAVAWLIGTT